MTGRIHARLDVTGLTCGEACMSSGGCRRTCALDQISFSLVEGERLAIEAPRESGAASLLGMLAGEIPADAGNVMVAGRRPEPGEIVLAGPLRHVVGPETPLEFLTLSLRLAGAGRRIARRGAEAELDTIGLRTVADLGLEQLHRHEAVRLSVAGAALRGARFILVDDPAAGCGAREGESLVRDLLGLAQRHRVGLIMTTDSARIAAMADRTLWLRRGELVDIAAPRLVRVV